MKNFFLATLLFSSTAALSFGAVAQLPPPALQTNSTPTTVSPAPDVPSTSTAPVRTEATPTNLPTAQPMRTGLTVGGVSVRGMTDVAAIKKLRQAHSPKINEMVSLWDGRTKHQVRRGTLGAAIPYYKLLAKARAMQQSGGDVPLAFEVDLNRTRHTLKLLAGKINHSPQTASLDVDDSDNVVMTGGEGANLAIEGSALRIQAALESEPPQSYIELVVARQPGTNTLRQFKYLLAEYSTPYDAGIRGRTNNLRMAARNIDGEVVLPGKVFSANRAIGPRNAAAGWREAKMFVDGQVVDGVGAGICQAATTLYNAALLANMPIAERHPHSFRVKYAPASRDASLYWGSKDFRFRNNTPGPLYVQTFVRNSRFYARLYGTQPLRVNVAIESRVLSTRNGTSSEAYRVVEAEGITSREKLSRDYYRPPAH